MEDAPITVSDESAEGSLPLGDSIAAEGVEVPRTVGWPSWPTRLHATEEEKMRKEEEKKRKTEEEEQRKKEEEDGGKVVSPPCDLSMEGAPDSSLPQE